MAGHTLGTNWTPGSGYCPRSFPIGWRPSIAWGRGLRNPGVGKDVPEWKRNTITADEWVEFLGRLARSPQRMASLYGRYGLLWWKWSHGDRSPEALQSLRTEVGAWLKDYAATEFASPTQARRVNEDIYKRGSELERQVVKALAPAATAPPPPSLPPLALGPRIPPKVAVVPANVARLRFQQIKLEVRRADGQTVPYQQWAQNRLPMGPLRGVLACGPDLDVFWAENTLALLREKGLLEEVPGCAKGGFLKLSWDGRNVWIVTREKGLWVMSPAGEVLAKIGAEQGLPPGDVGTLIHPLEPGKVCAVGSFGPQHRGWCAMIEFGQGGAKVNVFHRATHVPLPDDAESTRHDPERIFEPMFLHEYDPGPGRPRLLLVEGTYGPLTIDPRTLAVSTLGIQPQRKYRGAGRLNEWWFNRAGDVIGCGGVDDPPLQFARPGATFDDDSAAFGLGGYRGSWMFSKDHAIRPVLVKGGLQRVTGRQLLEYQGWIYVPSVEWRPNSVMPPWFRINAKTFDAETLVYEREAPRYAVPWGVSSHYGLVSLCDLPFRGSPGTLAQLVVVEPSKEDAAPGEEQKSAPRSDDAITAAAAQPQANAPPAPSLRTWRAAGGKYSVEATFVNAAAGTVMLRKADGSTIKVPIEKLSDEDQQYVRKRGP